MMFVNIRKMLLLMKMMVFMIAHSICVVTPASSRVTTLQALYPQPWPAQLRAVRVQERPRARWEGLKGSAARAGQFAASGLGCVGWVSERKRGCGWDPFAPALSTPCLACGSLVPVQAAKTSAVAVAFKAAIAAASALKQPLPSSKFLGIVSVLVCV